MDRQSASQAATQSVEGAHIVTPPSLPFSNWYFFLSRDKVNPRRFVVMHRLQVTAELLGWIEKQNDTHPSNRQNQWYRHLTARVRPAFPSRPPSKRHCLCSRRSDSVIIAVHECARSGFY